MLTMFAVIKTGGKQFKVKEGETLTIEKVAKAPGETLEFEVLLLGDEDGQNLKVGMPIVPDAKVESRVLEHGLGEKVSVIKFKPKVRYKRNVGHRQPYTKVKIEKIVV